MHILYALELYVILYIFIIAFILSCGEKSNTSKYASGVLISICKIYEEVG
jgi:ABC-type uncharacterized transport system permease subunit